MGRYNTKFLFLLLGLEEKVFSLCWSRNNYLHHCEFLYLFFRNTFFCVYTIIIVLAIIGLLYNLDYKIIRYRKNAIKTKGENY